jgi:hypothetical protein
LLSSSVAEEKLEVPSLLDAQDMADCSAEDGPDRFSVVTYVSQFYHLFKDSDDSRMSPSPSTRPPFNLSSDENDSLISSGSEAATPIGTPKTQERSTHLAARKQLFNQSELIAKYGEEIFSTSTPDKKKAGVGSVGALCGAFESKAKIRS